MKDRLRELRKNLKLSGEKFGERIGIGRSAVSNLESGRNNLTEPIILAICREFNVNEEWLRFGDGEMFLPVDRETEIAKLTKNLLLEEEDSFKNRVISVLANLTPEQWEVLRVIAEGLTKKGAVK
jgi:hypothetical protein